MRVVSLIAQKGGVGKTSISLGLGCAAAAAGHSVIVVDLDPQASAASWGDRRTRDTPTVLSVQPPRLARILAAANEQGLDIAVIDTAPRADQGGLAAAKASDLILIPCRPAIYDLETVTTTVELVRAAKPKATVRCVLNAVPPRGPRAGEARELLGELAVDVCGTVLGQRAIIDHAAVVGSVPMEYEPRSKAAREMHALFAEVSRLLGLPARRVRD